MKTYFSNHPVIDYRGLKLRNLMLNAQVIEGILRKTSVVYPYTLEEGDTPTMIAHDYYGSIDYVWLVFLSNRIVDPYTQWYKSQSDFEAYIIKKYGSIQEALSTIHHYTNTIDPEYPTVTPVTYDNMDPMDRGIYSPVSAYDYEITENEKRRVINLIDFRDAARISLELEKLLND